jgi:hypothetical protein
LDGPDYILLTSKALSSDLDTSYISSDIKRFTIDSTNNTLIIIDESKVSYTITIASGVYIVAGLMTAIATGLNTTASALSTWTVTFSTSTKFVTIATSSLTKTFCISSASKIGPLLGFINTTTPSLAATQTGKFQLDRSINKNVIRKIIINRSFSEKVVDISDYKVDIKYVKSRDIRSIDFQLRYPDDTLIDMNGKNWGCTISVFGGE